MMYDLELLREKYVQPESLADWIEATTAPDFDSAHRLLVQFYFKYGFNTLWAYKDQQWQAKYGCVLSLEEKRQYVLNMLGKPLQ